MNYWNTAGLLIDIAGAALIFFNSPEVNSNTFSYFESEMKEIEAKDRRIRKKARLGFALLALGFILQLAGSF